jgi:DNA-binding phage protein
MSKIKLGQILEHEDVMRPLRSEIERAGSQGAWAKMVGVNRTTLNKHLRGEYPLNMKVVKALGLRVVFTPTAEPVLKPCRNPKSVQARKRI